jgi:hypothetical protein
MARQLIINGDTGLIARTKLNDNFIELYDMTAENNESVVVAKTGSYTLGISDRGTYIRANIADPSSITITIPYEVDFPVNFEIMIERTGSGEVDIAADTGVTLHSVDDKTSINAQYQTVALKKVGAFEWVLFGALA